MDEDGDPAVREDLKGLGADQDRRNAASMCESHDDEITAPASRGVDDRLVGMFMLDIDRRTHHAG
jgi:hypothetical protein